MKILIIDNYDSFTFNLYQLVGSILTDLQVNFHIDVARNDAITTGEIRQRAYDRIILSPGPGNPADRAYFGVCADVLTGIGKSVPTLGVCLGMQGMAYYFGGQVIRAAKPMHGKTSVIRHDGKGIFTGLPQGLHIMRYHSLVADPAYLPDTLTVTATTIDTKEIMGLRHTIYPIEGIQFHPESFATEAGELLMKNFLIGKDHI